MSATIGIEDSPANPSGATILDVSESRQQQSLKIKRNAISGIYRFAILTVVYFLTYPYMLHHLGTERFGMWALALVVSQSLGTQDLGISGALMRFIPEHWNNGGSLRIWELASTAIFLLAGIGVLLATGPQVKAADLGLRAAAAGSTARLEEKLKSSGTPFLDELRSQACSSKFRKH